MILSLLTTTW